MTPPELTIAALFYAVSFLLSQRLIALVMPEAQEMAFAAAALAGSITAAVFFQRRQRRSSGEGAPIAVALTCGGTFAILAVVLGMFTQLLWQPFAGPLITIPVAALLTGGLPLVIFPLARVLFGERIDVVSAGEVTGTHATIVAVAALLISAGAFAIPAGSRVNVKFVDHRLPGLIAALPDWPASQETLLFDSGAIKVDDPGQKGFVAVHWTVGDPVQPDDYVNTIIGDQLIVRDRTPAYFARHEGVSYTVVPKSGSATGAATVWNCAPDHRVLWILTYWGGDEGEMQAIHRRVLDGTRCHTDERPTSQPAFPTFVAPPGFKRDPQSPSLLFVGPKEQTILFEGGAIGRSGLTTGRIGDEIIVNMMKEVAALERLDGAPAMKSVRDLLGHERRVWSAAGSKPDGAVVQVEVMVWYCDVRNMTFIGAYATRGKHAVDEGIDALLPAVCHNK